MNESRPPSARDDPLAGLTRALPAAARRPALDHTIHAFARQQAALTRQRSGHRAPLARWPWWRTAGLTTLGCGVVASAWLAIFVPRDDSVVLAPADRARSGAAAPRDPANGKPNETPARTAEAEQAADKLAEPVVTARGEPSPTAALKREQPVTTAAHEATNSAELNQPADATAGASRSVAQSPAPRAAIALADRKAKADSAGAGAPEAAKRRDEPAPPGARSTEQPPAAQANAARPAEQAAQPGAPSAAEPLGDAASDSRRQADAAAAAPPAKPAAPSKQAGREQQALSDPKRCVERVKSLKKARADAADTRAEQLLGRCRERFPEFDFGKALGRSPQSPSQTD